MPMAVAGYMKSHHCQLDQFRCLRGMIASDMALRADRKAYIIVRLSSYAAFIHYLRAQCLFSNTFINWIIGRMSQYNFVPDKDTCSPVSDYQSKSVTVVGAIYLVPRCLRSLLC
jgi:hypothetical protein